MAYYGGYGTYYRQPTKGELITKANASIRRLEKSGREMHPIRIEGTKIARTWWGQAWCDNLERYADFSNRVGRGKRYVRAGCVIDLIVERGLIRALVQGSRAQPYEVEIKIDPLSEEAFSKLLDQCSARADSLEALVAGDFPEQLKNTLFAERGGLFPAPREIKFDCSCPDWASMCKHVAAAIMAVAPQLDENPLALFELRGVDTASLVKRTVAQKLDLMLKNADAPSPRIMEVDDEELTALFGVL